MHSPSVLIRSLFVWATTIALFPFWLALLSLIRIFDRTPNLIRTGIWFRRLGRVLTAINPFWQLEIVGPPGIPQDRAFVVVSNHQSLADIPLISNLKGEMKWVAKEELFSVPVVGWMMSLAGDIPVDRKNPRSGGRMLLTAKKYLDGGCSVMFFPEGTRSLDGSVGAFNDGPFYLARKAGVPILPIAVEGSHHCLPKHSWIFGEPAKVKLRLFSPVDTTGVTPDRIPQLRESVRSMIISQVDEWRIQGVG